LHINDFTKALLRVIETDYTGDINFGSGRLLSIKEIASIICNIVNSDSDIIPVAIKDYTANIVMDITRANQVLNWQPSILFEDGIKELIAQKRAKLNDR
jgi:nucleoside-diphosphate-sugar epimerase